MTRLHVNLLFEAERRDPKVMVMRTTLVTLALVAVAAIGLFVLYFFWMLKDVEHRQGRAHDQWERLLRDSNKAIQLREACDSLGKISADLAAFSNAQIRVGDRLLALAEAVPAEVQLIELRLHQSEVDESGIPARQHEFKITGRTAAYESDTRVQLLIQRLQAIPGDSHFGDVRPEGIKIDPLSKDVLVNVFELRSLMEPRRYR